MHLRFNLRFKIWDFTIRQPSYYRLGHACETFQLDGRTMVIVVGGLAGRYSNVTEIWDPMSQFGWQEGKLPPSCNSFLRKDI